MELCYNFYMHSELGTLFGFHLQMYGLMLALGFVLSYVLARLLARRTGRNPDEVDTLIMVAAVCGVIGARTVFVAQNWEKFAGAPLEAFALWQGGLVFYGGFILAVLGLVAYALAKREPVRRLLDFCVVFVPLGQAFGRVGCFFHGCCFGGVGGGAIGVRFPMESPAWQHQVAEGLISRYAAQSLPVWPTQLIEAAGCLVLFGALWWLYRARREWVGMCCGVYAVAYAALRFVGECLRDDPRGAFHFGLSFSQCVSVGLLVVGLGFLVTSFLERRHGTVDGE